MRSVLDALFPALTSDERWLFEESSTPWEVVARLKERLDQKLAAGVVMDENVRVAGGVIIDCRKITIGAGAVVEPGAVILEGPVYIGPGAHVRSGAYIRGAAYIGAGALVGHATEVKNGILLAGAKAPHFNYVGDSILGHGVNLGAGSILSNYRLDGKPVKVTWSGRREETGLTKLGAIVGDRCSIGCNVVCNPGTILLPGTRIPPVTAVSGTPGAGESVEAATTFLAGGHGREVQA